MLLRLSPPPAPRVERKPIEVELRIIPRTAATPVKLPAERAATTTRKSSSQPSSRPLPPPQQSASAQPARNGQPAGFPGTAPDAPHAGGASLEPRISTVLPGIGNGEGDDAQGHLVVNGPGEAPDPEALAEYTREKVARKVGNTVDGLLGDAAKAAGTLPPYFSRLQGAMNDDLAHAQVELTDKTKKQKFDDVADTWLLPAQQYARTGSPFANPQDEAAVTDTGFGKSVQRGGLSGRDATENRQNEAALQSLAGMQVLLNSASRPRLKLVLELRQTSSGALAETVVLQKSGDEKFDEFVLHRTRLLITREGDTEDGDSPWHDEKSDDFRSVWQFTWEPPKVKALLLRVLRTPPRTFEQVE